ncbi:hypothetical protein [Mucilaginibacter gilvus]|uniref:Uncharacterized protein n=1 Tax=Mucilaginibacter gilvus TaxID=2305909 RepID=A0A3S3UX50_9SPHI|nr:hypothetical protein [Mucilaginibacter gilvus]RWY50259.1 hypothetical protein EPL05_16040 [Mucilaginibacter gilvus]
MKTRRRLGEKSKTNETKAAATGANIALATVMFEFFVFIMDEFNAFNFCANYCIIIYLCKKKL